MMAQALLKSERAARIPTVRSYRVRLDGGAGRGKAGGPDPHDPGRPRAHPRQPRRWTSGSSQAPACREHDPTEQHDPDQHPAEQPADSAAAAVIRRLPPGAAPRRARRRRRRGSRGSRGSRRAPPVGVPRGTAVAPGAAACSRTTGAGWSGSGTDGDGTSIQASCLPSAYDWTVLSTSCRPAGSCRTRMPSAQRPADRQRRPATVTTFARAGQPPAGRPEASRRSAGTRPAGSWIRTPADPGGPRLRLRGHRVSSASVASARAGAASTSTCARAGPAASTRAASAGHGHDGEPAQRGVIVTSPRSSAERRSGSH